MPEIRSSVESTNISDDLFVDLRDRLKSVSTESPVTEIAQETKLTPAVVQGVKNTLQQRAEAKKRAWLGPDATDELDRP